MKKSLKYTTLIKTKKKVKFYGKIKKFKIKRIAKVNNIIKCLFFLLTVILLFKIKVKSENGSSFSIKNQEKGNSNEVEFKKIHESFNSSTDFLNKSIKGIIIQDKQKFILSENPIASAVIPLYNCKAFVIRAITSIQNQNIYNLEIILVNDFSTDDIIPFIENLKREDPRIKLINNNKNMGTLYSRSIGVLAAKGKYIFPLDNDDMFLDKDVFKTITNIAEIGPFDLVEFKGIESLKGISHFYNSSIKDISFTRRKKLNLIMYQPELGNYPIRLNKNLDGYDINDAYLWAKCIKTEKYQKATNYLGEERYSRFMLAHEDIIMIYLLFNTIESYKFVGKYGILHTNRWGSSWKKSIFMRFYWTKKELFFLDAVIDYPKNINESKNLSVTLMNMIMGAGDLENLLNHREYYKNLFYSCLDRIFNSTLISNEQKIKLRNKGKNLTFLNYSF